jgi:hypothetical protein
MGTGKILAGDTMIFLNIGGNSSNNVRSSHDLPDVGMTLTVSVFARLYLLDDVVNLHYSQGHVPKFKVNVSYNFCTAFTASGKDSNQVAHLRYSSHERGWHKQIAACSTNST